jgi:hypothetical protein
VQRLMAHVREDPQRRIVVHAALYKLPAGSPLPKASSRAGGADKKVPTPIP